MRTECATFEITISAYLDGESTEQEKQGVFLHLAECGDCRSFLESLVNMKVDSARERKAVLSPALDAQILRISRQAQPAKAVTSFQPRAGKLDALALLRRLRETKIPLSFAAAALIILMAGTFALSSYWMHSQLGAETPKERDVYIHMLPAVEVEPHVVRQQGLHH